MLTKDGCAARRERLWDRLPRSCEWMLVADPRHVHYFSGFWINPLSFSNGERALLLLERRGPTTLFADNFARRSAARDPFVDDEVIEPWYDHRNAVISRDTALRTALASRSERIGSDEGLVEIEALPIAMLDLLHPNVVTQSRVELPGTVIRGLRRRKHPDEIALLQRCMRAGEAGHARAREVVRPGLSEFDVYLEIQSAAMAEAGRPVLVYGDFRATNAQQFKAGGLPTSYVLADTDLFIADFSVVIDGYRSDFTNTYAVGKPTPQQRAMFDACLAGMAAGESALRAGVRGGDVYNAVSNVIGHAGFDRLTHHAGHGIGLAHPEPPILVLDSDDVLVADDVVTLEPGLYIDGAGGMRFEHNYRVVEDGFERLSRHNLSLD